MATFAKGLNRPNRKLVDRNKEDIYLNGTKLSKMSPRISEVLWQIIPINTAKFSFPTNMKGSIGSFDTNHLLPSWTVFHGAIVLTCWIELTLVCSLWRYYTSTNGTYFLTFSTYKDSMYIVLKIQQIYFMVYSIVYFVQRKKSHCLVV